MNNKYITTKQTTMCFQEWLNAKYKENEFELTECATISFLVQYAAPFTGGTECVIPSGTRFIPHQNMRADALYMHDQNLNDSTLNMIEDVVKNYYPHLFKRWRGVSFYITEEQLKTLPIKFLKGSLPRLLKLMELSREQKLYKGRFGIIRRTVTNFRIMIYCLNVK